MMDREGSAPAPLCPLHCQSHCPRRDATASWAGRAGATQLSMASQISTRINQIKARTREEMKCGLGQRKGEWGRSSALPRSIQDTNGVGKLFREPLFTAFVCSLGWIPPWSLCPRPSPPAMEQRGQLGPSAATVAGGVERHKNREHPEMEGIRKDHCTQLLQCWNPSPPRLPAWKKFSGSLSQWGAGEGQLLSCVRTWTNTLLPLRLWGCLFEGSLCWHTQHPAANHQDSSGRHAAGCITSTECNSHHTGFLQTRVLTWLEQQQISLLQINLKKKKNRENKIGQTWIFSQNLVLSLKHRQWFWTRDWAECIVDALSH